MQIYGLVRGRQHSHCLSEEGGWSYKLEVDDRTAAARHQVNSAKREELLDLERGPLVPDSANSSKTVPFSPLFGSTSDKCASS